MNTQYTRLAQWFIRIGLAFVYGYAAVEMYLNPNNFFKYIPQNMSALIPMNLFLPLFGAFEILLTLWLLSGKKTQYAGLISFFLMASIIMPNTQYFSILFRNVSIALSSLALVALDHGAEKNIY